MSITIMLIIAIGYGIGIGALIERDEGGKKTIEVIGNKGSLQDTEGNKKDHIQLETN